MQNQILRRTIAAKQDNQVLSNEGGKVYEVDAFTALRRFLILGSTGTFYDSAARNTELATAVVEAAVREDPQRAANMAVEVHTHDLALRTDPALYVWARLTLPDVPLDVRRQVYSAVPHFCRTGTQFLHWLAYRKGMGKSNRSFRRAVTQWFLQRTPGELALQAVKYDQRDGWSLRDALRLAKPVAPSPDYAAVFDWIAHPDKRAPMTLSVSWDEMDENARRLFSGYEWLRADLTEPSHVPAFIRQTRMPREAVPSPLLQHREVWEALFPDMPAQAFIRNLGKLTSLGLFDDDTAMVAGQKIAMAASKLHPFAFLIARKMYAQGHGDKGKLTWTPNPFITDALDEAFGMAFGTLPINENVRPLIALDISGSMSWTVNDSPLTCYEAEAALAMVLAYQYPKAEFVYFSHQLSGFQVEGGYDDVLRKMEALSYHMGGTYLDLPLDFARQSFKARHVYTDGSMDEPYDAVVTITDSETHHRREYPSGIVKDIHKVHPEFRHAVVALAGNKISVADPSDPLQMDLCGMDASLPIALEGFLSRKF